MITDAILLGGNELGGQSKAKIAASGRLAVIQYGHLAVHEDIAVAASDFTSEVTDTETRDYLIAPDSDYNLHSYLLKVTADVGAQFRIYEVPDTDLASAGTPITHMRLNQASTVGDTERVFTYHTPTLASTANLTLKWITHNGGSTAKTPSGQSLGGDFSHQGEEIIFAKGSNPYLIEVKPDATAEVAFIHEYYEVTHAV